MVAMDHAFAVPLVTARVSRRETYAQIVNALTALDEASASVFDGVKARVEEQHACLADLDARLGKANAKISKLAAIAGKGSAGVSRVPTTGAGGSTRTPIVVTAPARYPSKIASDEVLHHDALSVHCKPTEDRPRVIPRRTQDEHDAAEAELFERRASEADVLELFRRLRVPKRREEVEPEDEDESENENATPSAIDAGSATARSEERDGEEVRHT